MKVLRVESTPLEPSKAENRIQLALRMFSDGKLSDPINFFQAWAIPPPVIAERLRISGFHTTAEEVTKIIEGGIRRREDKYLLMVAMQEMKNDIIKTLHQF